MKCLSRSTLGVAIGAINICCFTVLIVYVIVLLCDVSNLSEEEKQNHSEILSTSVAVLYIVLIASIVSLIISGLLIVGIIKQRNTYMKPWIYSAIFGIALYILRLIVSIVVGLTSDLSVLSILGSIVIGLLTLGVQLLIFYPIYTLYTDIRDAANAQEQRGLNVCPQSPPSYAELDKEGEMYN